MSSDDLLCTAVVVVTPSLVLRMMTAGRRNVHTVQVRFWTSYEEFVLYLSTINSPDESIQEYTCGICPEITDQIDQIL